ncbi:hypothetical protein [Parathermosynechococcus lividus]|nr:hypothetical protein [Synechococcus sp. PCC 6716]
MLSELLEAARFASTQLAQASYSSRQEALLALINALKTAEPLLLEQNTLDLESSRDLAVSGIVLGWLRLTHERLQRITRWLEQLYQAPDPWVQALPTGRNTFRYAVPLGVIGLIYEGLPTLSLLMAGLALKTGNALVMWGGASSRFTAQAIANVLQDALSRTSLPLSSLQTLPFELPPASWLSQPKAVDVAIAHGRSRFLAEHRSATCCPFVPLALGNSYLVWDGSVSPEVILSCIQQSHDGSPDRPLAIEKIIVLAGVNPSHLTFVMNELAQAGYKSAVDEYLRATYPELPMVDATEWSLPYLNQRLAWHYEEDLGKAIAWINRYGTTASVIATTHYQDCCQFYQQVHTPLVYLNRSPQLERLSALAIGVVAERGAYQGVMGIEQWLSTKQIWL